MRVRKTVKVTDEMLNDLPNCMFTEDLRNTIKNGGSVKLKLTAPKQFVTRMAGMSTRLRAACQWWQLWCKK